MRFLQLLLGAALFLSVAAYLALRAPTDHDARIALVQDLAERGVSRGYWPGLMWAEVAPGRIVTSGAVGFADIAAGRPMTTETTMPIGSISKVIVGLSAAQAIRDGALDPHAPLTSYLTVPVDAPDGQSRTFAHLATHTAGIIDTDAGYEEQGYHFGSTAHPILLKEFLAGYLGREGELYSAANFGPWAPGSRYEYSNVGAALAAQAVEDATGTAFADYSRGVVAAPLGLSGFWGHLGSSSGDRATLYGREETGAFEALELYGLATWPDGQFNASVTDLARLLAVVMAEGRFEDDLLVDPDVVALLTEPRASDIAGLEDPDNWIGLFWSEENLSFGPFRATFQGHSGGDPGVLTLMYRTAGTENGFVVMMNGLPEGLWAEVQLVRMVRLLAEMQYHRGE